jgi:hypothetical protein
MKVFVWERVEKCTDSYHPEGGVVVFANDEERARDLAKVEYCRIGYNEKPDYVRTVYGEGERVFLFPDAGCC